MLAPVAEAQFGEDALLDLSLRAAASFPAFCAELEEASGSDPGLRASGTLVVARDRDEAEALDRLLAFRQRLGLAVERLLPTAARRAEPALAPTVRLALDIAGDHSVDPRRLVAALGEAVRRSGGSIRRARVARLVSDGARVTGVALAGGEVVGAGAVLVAAGAHSGRSARSRCARSRGRCCGCATRTAPGSSSGRSARTTRTSSRAPTAATCSARRWRSAASTPRRPRAACSSCCATCPRSLPGVLELELEELLAGLRPTTPDNLPAIGAGELDGLFWATGHHRNGILLSGLTGELAAAALCGEEMPAWRAVDPARASRGVPA